jgi:hypothetical protein
MGILLITLFVAFPVLSEAFVLSPSQTIIQRGSISYFSGLSRGVHVQTLAFNPVAKERKKGPTAAPISIRASAQPALVASDLYGVYSWTYSGGSFPVELRAEGNFYCKSYPASAKWELQGNTLKIDWKKYGKYELQVNSHCG